MNESEVLRTINKQIDGEITQTEKESLDQVLKSDEKIRLQYENLQKTIETKAQVANAKIKEMVQDSEKLKQINDQIEAYAKAVRERDPEAVSELFAEHFDHIVHGAGTDPDNPWNTKKETNREGIREIYEAFLSNVVDMTVEYTDRTIDIECNSAAMVVRVKSGSVCMENALHIKWNDDGKITFFYNWYGQSLNRRK